MEDSDGGKKNNIKTLNCNKVPLDKVEFIGLFNFAKIQDNSTKIFKKFLKKC